MPRDTDVVVVGGGVTGLATARALALGGLGVVVLERHDLGHERGSSHGSSRIFRLAYADERFVRLAQSALAGWHELEAECGYELVVRLGGLDVGPDVAEIARGLSSCGVSFQLLTGADAARRWAIAFEPGEQVLYQPDGGFTRSDVALRALAESALAAGAEILERRPVTSLDVEPRVVHVHTPERIFQARAVVFTVGAWARGLLDPLGIELPVVPTRETVSYFRLQAAEALPPVIDWGTTAADAHGVVRAGQASYGLPSPGLGLKAGLHHSGPVADADEDGAPEEGAMRWAAEWVARRYPEADPSPLAGETCLYTNTADEGFVLERHGRVVVGSACSGHGFKFAPSVGRTLAALARDAAG
jgi:sarcosine oxidase